jgi:hypothetical protein
LAPVVSALAKAKEHLAAADSIAALGNFPLAFSHVVLGLEEMAVGKVHNGTSLGLFSVGDPPDEEDPFRVNRDPLYLHRSRLVTIVFHTALWRTERAHIESALEEHCHDDRSEQDRDGGARPIEDVFEEDVQPLLDDFDRQEPLKEGGFYSAEQDRRGRPAERRAPTSTDGGRCSPMASRWRVSF